MQRREYVFEESMVSLNGGQSSSVAVSGTSAQSAAITAGRAVLYSTADVFFRQGANPTALASGVDQLLPANNIMRLADITSGNKLAFITSGTTGTVYITPGG